MQDMTPTSCGDCRRPLIPRRRKVLPAGHARHMAFGLCSTCYSRDRRLNAPPPVPVEPDWVVIHRVLSGVLCRTSPAERRIIVDSLTERGMSAMAIAARLGITQRSVVRIRTRDRKRGAA